MPQSFHSRVTPSNPIWLKYGNFSTASNDNAHTTRQSLCNHLMLSFLHCEAFVVGYFSEIQNSNKLVQTQYPSDIQQKCNCYLVMLLVSCTHHGPSLVQRQRDTEPFLQQGLTWVIKARTKILSPGDITIYKYSNSAGRRMMTIAPTKQYLVLWLILGKGKHSWNWHSYLWDLGGGTIIGHEHANSGEIIQYTFQYIIVTVPVMWGGN